jgi:hypothetical protein
MTHRPSGRVRWALASIRTRRVIDEEQNVLLAEREGGGPFCEDRWVCDEREYEREPKVRIMGIP